MGQTCPKDYFHSELEKVIITIVFSAFTLGEVTNFSLKQTILIILDQICPKRVNSRLKHKKSVYHHCIHQTPALKDNFDFLDQICPKKVEKCPDGELSIDWFNKYW